VKIELIIQRAFKLDELICQKNTGSIQQLAKTLSLSERQTYKYLKAFRTIGKPITFSKHKKSYCYTNQEVMSSRTVNNKNSRLENQFPEFSNLLLQTIRYQKRYAVIEDIILNEKWEDIEILKQHARQCEEQVKLMRLALSDLNRFLEKHN